MVQLKQKKTSLEFLNYFSAVLIFGFLFFVVQGAQAADYEFTAGWYRDHGSEEDSSCEAGKWRGYVEVKDYLGNPLIPDELTIEAIWYGEHAVPLYKKTWSSPTSSIFETDCVIDIKSSGDTKITDIIVLEIKAKKAGYYDMKAANSQRNFGESFSQAKWSKTLYLAQLGEKTNIAYTFPENYQWISREDSEMKIYIDKWPHAEKIKDIFIKFIHSESEKEFTKEITKEISVDIDRGEISFILPEEIIDHGEYSWQVILARSSTPSIFYNEDSIGFFNFDPNPPILDSFTTMPLRSGKEQAPLIQFVFEDVPLPSSGMHKIEIYLNDGPGTALELIKTCTSATEEISYSCSYVGEYEEYLESKTYRYYSVAYDFAGNQTITQERSFTINLISSSYLDIVSRVDNSSITGVPFEVIDVYNIIGEGDYPEIGNYQTNKKFEGTVDQYTIKLEAPDSYNNRPFSFWMRGNNCYLKNPLSWPVSYGYNYTLIMHFGVSRLMIYSRYLINAISMSSDLLTQIQQIKTRIEQTGGTPLDFLSSSGYIDHTGTQFFYKTVTGEINNLSLRFYDSEDGILKFAGFRFIAGDNPFCENINEQGCQGSSIYECKMARPQYAINRTVRVESRLGDNLIGGVAIEGVGNMESGTTATEGYYEFSSTAQPNNFTGTLWAPESINVGGQEFKFDGWECKSVSADKLGCHIGTDNWYEDVSVIAKANYGGSPETPSNYCGDTPPSECTPDKPYYCDNGIQIPCCSICNCPSGFTCDTFKNPPCGECIPIGPSINDFKSEGVSCGQSRIPIFSWDVDTAENYDYQIWLCANLDCLGPDDPLVSDGASDTNSTSWTAGCSYCCGIDPYNKIEFGTTYYAQVRAKKLSDTSWSDNWSSSINFTTANNCYPYPEFDCNGKDCSILRASEDEVVVLTDKSTVYDLGSVICSWDLPAGSTIVDGSPSDCEIEVAFAQGQDQEIKLTAKDSNGYECSKTKKINVRMPLPEYKEVRPVSWLGNIFAGMTFFLKI